MAVGCAELEIGLSRSGADRYSLRYRFWQPQGDEESNLGLDDPAPVVIDFAGLLALQADPLAYGARLSELLFADPAARAAFGKARERADALRVPLRLRLFIESAASELQALAWETLLDPDRHTRLCVDENVPFSRFLSSANLQPFSPPERARLRALVVISSPSNMDPNLFAPVDTPAELLRAKTALADMDVVALASGGQATLTNLLAGLRGAPAGSGHLPGTGAAPGTGVAPGTGLVPGTGTDILYLVAHGYINRASGPALLLEKPDGRGESIAVDRLVSELKALRTLPLLAVLVSCESAGSGGTTSAEVMRALGPQLAQGGVPAVLAMRGSVSFPTIDAFLPAFFRELGRDGQIDRAAAAARGQVSSGQGWWMPVLFSRLRNNQLMQPPAIARPLALLPYEPETIYIAPGAFQMGRSPASAAGVSPVTLAAESAPAAAAWEQPCHTVELPGYRIGKTPVTNRQYAEFVRQTSAQVNPEAGWDGQAPPPDRLDYPMIGVTWYQAMSYCAWLSSKTGRKYSLPNEAQWEKAVRGVDGRLYPWGNEWLPERCNSDPAQITPVTRYPPQNDAGVYDMVGNAREWTLTVWGDDASTPRYPYPWADDERNDPKANSLMRRVFRGGVVDPPAGNTCAARGSFDPSKSGLPRKRHGFRVVLPG